MKKKRLYFLATLLLLFLPIIRVLFVKCQDIFLVDLAAYSAVSRALFEGNNPFPNHMENLFCSFGRSVPIVFPGQMLFFALPGFIWGNTVQILYLVLDVAIVYYLTALTLIRACGYSWEDIWKPGKKQFVYALCSFAFLFSSNTMVVIRTGQIVLVLALCLYGIFWGPACHWFRTLEYAFIAVAKYSVLPVFAPLLFVKGHWRLCLTAFGLFLLLSLSPVLCGNNLIEVYTGYFEAVQKLFQSGEVNHFNMSPQMCHFGFFKFSALNHILKAIAICPILWLFWCERKSEFLSDTAFLLALTLTMLISYHGLHDITLLFPLLFIRLFDFAQKRQWIFFWITFLFMFYLVIPGSVTLTISSWIGSIQGIDSLVWLSNNPWGSHFKHVFPLTPFFASALTLWSLYLYLHVKEPYHFVFPETKDTPSIKNTKNTTTPTENKI